MQTEEEITGIGAGVGAEAKVDLGELSNSMKTLFNALAQTSDSLADVTGEVIRTVNKIGLDNLIGLVKEGNEEAKQLLGGLYMVMERAAAKGAQEAGQFVSTLERKLDEAGYRITSGGDCGPDCGCKHNH